MSMRKMLWIVAAAGVLGAGAARADSDAHMQAARKNLASARAELKAADHDYDGHRRDALDLVDRAIGQVDDGIKIGTRRDARDDNKVHQLEHKEQKLENRIEKLKD
jgi:hypothetical protein